MELSHIQTTEAICSPKIIQNIETLKTTKRQSDVESRLSMKNLSSMPTSTCQTNSKKILPSLKEGQQTTVFESQVQTERRGDQKLLVKLKNDLELLTEMFTEEKEKTTFLENQVKIYEFKLSSHQTQNEGFLKKIEYLEDQLSKVTDELTTTKSFYEELVQNL